MFVKGVVPFLAVFLVVARAALVGEPTDADINSPEVRNALQFAVAQYNAQSNSIYISEVVNVIKAQEQIVSGIKYIFTVVMAITSHKKEEGENICTIPPEADVAQLHECTFEVWCQPWLNTMQLIKNTC